MNFAFHLECGKASYIDQHKAEVLINLFHDTLCGIVVCLLDQILCSCHGEVAGISPIMTQVCGIEN